MSVPRKPNKSKRIDLSERRQWKAIIKSAGDPTDASLDIIDMMVFNLIDGSTVEFDITALLTEGFTLREIAKEINNESDRLGDKFIDVTYYFNIDNIILNVKPMTAKILKNL